MQPVVYTGENRRATTHVRRKKAKKTKKHEAKSKADTENHTHLFNDLIPNANVPRVVNAGHPKPQNVRSVRRFDFLIVPSDDDLNEDKKKMDSSSNKSISK